MLKANGNPEPIAGIQKHERRVESTDEGMGSGQRGLDRESEIDGKSLEDLFSIIIICGKLPAPHYYFSMTANKVKEP